jgi:hypothetical protein
MMPAPDHIGSLILRKLKQLRIVVTYSPPNKRTKARMCNDQMPLAQETHTGGVAQLKRDIY